jgi:hypothetical protein
MATRSTIGYETLDGGYRGVYCHYDGYEKHMVPILSEMLHAEVAIMVERAIMSGGIRTISDGGHYELFDDGGTGDPNTDWPSCPEEYAYRKLLDGRLEVINHGRDVTVVGKVQ